MKKSREGFFWVSFSDLMTSLFFIVLVLYVLTFIELNRRNEQLKEDAEELKRKLRVYDLVEQNIKPLKEDTALFRYEERYKRFTLAFDVKFKAGKYKIDAIDIEIDPIGTLGNLHRAGIRLLQIVTKLETQKKTNPEFANISYLLIISGYASKSSGEKGENYHLSYNRALALWSHWNSLGINFEKKEYENLIDLQIAGNGWGGVGRIPYTDIKNEESNQRFIIQIIPKIGKTD